MSIEKGIIYIYMLLVSVLTFSCCRCGVGKVLVVQERVGTETFV